MIEETKVKASAYSWYALALLTFVYLLNFLDRQLVYALYAPIQKEFTLTDLQLSVIGASAFVLFYTTLGIPFGRMADKGSRKKLIAIGLAVWSLFSGLTGFAVGFKSLFFFRLMVGVGEATLGPAAFSLLADYFPPNKRATVSSIYSMGIALGAGLAAFLGGWIGLNYGWRWAFYLLGFPGIVFAILVFFLREEPRGKTEVQEVGYTSNDWKALLKNRPFIYICIGYSLFGLATNNLSIWGLFFYTRVYRFDIALVGFWAGILTIIAGIPATLLGGYIADIFRRKHKGGRMIYGSLLAIVSVPFWIILLYTNNLFLILLTNTVLRLTALGWLGAAAADVTEIAGVNLRGLAIAIFFFAVNLTAYLIGSNVIGFLSDIFGVAQNAQVMRHTLLVCPVACALGALMLWLGSKEMNQQT